MMLDGLAGNSGEERYLVAELERLMSEYSGAPLTITGVRRELLAYRSSAHIEAIDLTLHDGSTLPLIFKDLSPRALLPEARLARPHFLYQPQRELAVYRALLPNLNLDTAWCYGTVADVAAGRYWLFLERVEGVPLGEVGDMAVWEEAARWLARFHRRAGLVQRNLDQRIMQGFLRHDLPYFRTWLDRTRAVAARLHVKERGAWELPLRMYERSLPLLAEQAPALLHGEFYPANILVHQAGRIRICPVDWEVMSVGSPLMDLAALVSGGWTAVERDRLIAAYADAARIEGLELPHNLQEVVRCCRLHVALQWLAWSPNWTPPAAHATDWLASAAELAAETA